MDRPRVNWPSKSGFYKAVQLYVTIDDKEKPFLRLATHHMDEVVTIEVAAATFHNSILMLALREQRINPGYSHFPELSGERYRVVGMGQLYVDVTDKMVLPRGGSSRYKIEMDYKHLDEILSLETSWKRLEPAPISLNNLNLTRV